MKGEKISLGLLLEEDAEFLYENFNDMEVKKYMIFSDKFFSINEEKEFIENQYNSSKNYKYTFAIVENETSKICGLISLFVNDIIAKVGGIGYWISKEFWGKGYTSEAVQLILEFGKKTLNLRKVVVHVYSPNIGSQKVLEKNGFKLVGKLKENAWKNGEYVDEFIYEKFL